MYVCVESADYLQNGQHILAADVQRQFLSVHPATHSIHPNYI